MADLPILFSAPMVRALLREIEAPGTGKTQTRRVLPSAHPRFPHQNQIRTNVLAFDPAAPKVWYWDGIHDRVGASYPIRYATGDRLWVREAVTWVSAWGWRYRADNDDLTEKREAGEVYRFKPSIHMPRSASRLTLTVTDVRVQRLQEISEDDAQAEGVEGDGYGGWLCYASQPKHETHWADPRESYRTLWNSLHGPGAWAANPWVAAYTFTVQHGNIDQIGEAR